MPEKPTFEQLEFPLNQPQPNIPDSLAGDPVAVEAIIRGRERAKFDLEHPDLQQLPLPRKKATESDDNKIDYNSPEEREKLRDIAELAIRNQLKSDRAVIGSKAQNAKQPIDKETLERGVPLNENTPSYQGRSDASLRRIEEAEKARYRGQSHGRGPGY